MTRDLPAPEAHAAARAALQEILIREAPAAGLDRRDALRSALETVRARQPATRLDYDLTVRASLARCTYDDDRRKATIAIVQGLGVLGCSIARGYTLARGIVALERAIAPDRYGSDDDEQPCVDDDDAEAEQLAGRSVEWPAGHVRAWRARVAVIEAQLAQTRAA